MTERLQIASAVARALRAASLPSLHAVMGFDGFVDEITDVVGKRLAPDRYDRLATIKQFAARIDAAAGESSNFELVVRKRKLGGNGPIMANALAAMGLRVTYIGTVGGNSAGTAVEPVFAEFARRATLIPLAPPAHTTALEFSDGKLMLGDLAPLSDVTWERLVEKVGAAQLRRLFEESSLLGLVNWTMLPHLTAIWRRAGEELLPGLSARPRRLFIDLADPQKREAADLREGLEVLAKLNGAVAVTLGLNLSEAAQVARVLGISHETQTPGAPRDLAVRIREKLGLATVVIHPRQGAAAATATESGAFAGPFVQHPQISTGAGDHFNAGFALGELLGLPLVEALCLGTATSGYYVRNAASPARDQLADFLDSLPDPEA
jgi:sugar/nucleoside kinase (ribokinase family)